MFEVLCISFAFFLGLAVRPLGLPPLVGLLAAGFAVKAFGPSLGLPEEPGAILQHVAHEAVVMAMNDVEAKPIAARKLRERGFVGPIVSQALYADHLAHHRGGRRLHLPDLPPGRRRPRRSRLGRAPGGARTGGRGGRSPSDRPPGGFDLAGLQDRDEPPPRLHCREEDP